IQYMRSYCACKCSHWFILLLRSSAARSTIHCEQFFGLNRQGSRSFRASSGAYFNPGVLQLDFPARRHSSLVSHRRSNLAAIRLPCTSPSTRTSPRGNSVVNSSAAVSMDSLRCARTYNGRLLESLLERSTTMKTPAAGLSCLAMLLAGCSGPPAGAAEASNEKFTVTAMAQFEEPWAMTFLPDGRLLVSEKKGALKVYQIAGQMHDVRGVPDVDYGGQGGFGDVVLHPQFARNKLVYLS